MNQSNEATPQRGGAGQVVSRILGNRSEGLTKTFDVKFDTAEHRTQRTPGPMRTREADGSASKLNFGS